MKTKVIENEDKDLVKQIRETIKKHQGHCCCALEFNDDNLCMCKDFREKIKKGELGYCDCTLYQIVPVSEESK